MNMDLVPSTNRPPSGGPAADELGFGDSEVKVFEEDEGPANGGCEGRACRATGAVKGEGCEGAKEWEGVSGPCDLEGVGGAGEGGRGGRVSLAGSWGVEVEGKAECGGVCK